MQRRFWCLLILLAIVVAACGGTAEPPPPTATPTLDPQAAMGKQVFTRECGSCHSLSPDTVIVGPSLAGISRRAASRVPGQDARVYIMTSILRPGDYVVEGYDDLMPANFGKKLTGEEVDALVAFLMTQ
ncbi:MAG: cytochrome c [Chloroflexi bacterium]|nr:MAG: cytochrome c [Chloroflexota bacterium]